MSCLAGNTKYKPYLDWDNRRSEGRSCLSLEKLRTIVAEASRIHANIGSASGKMSRILTQAEGWVKEYETLLVRCNIVKKDEADSQQHFFVTLPQMAAAAEAAVSGVSLDLDEAKELEKLVLRFSCRRSTDLHSENSFRKPCEAQRVGFEIVLFTHDQSNCASPTPAEPHQVAA